MKEFRGGSQGHPLQANTPREVAEIVASELRKRGCPVTPGMVDFIESQVEDQVGQIMASQQLAEMINSQLRSPLHEVGEQVRQMSRAISWDMIHG